MTNFEIGDKVKFLNAIGGGVVKKVAGGMVYVEDESGFDMPFAPSELIRMAEQQGVGKVFNDETIGQSAEQKAKEEHREPTQLELIEENRRLRSQNANLQDQINWNNEEDNDVMRGDDCHRNNNVLQERTRD